MDVREKATNEKRLIDANALKSYMDECSKETRFRVYYGYATSFIDAAPTVDAVEVVRCRECKYLEKDDGLKYGRMCLKLGNSSLCHDDDFCNYGERKEGTD